MEEKAVHANPMHAALLLHVSTAHSDGGSTQARAALNIFYAHKDIYPPARMQQVDGLINGDSGVVTAFYVSAAAALPCAS